MPDTATTPEERARKRVQDLIGLVVHAFVFVAVNAFLWIQDIVAGGGIEWAYWATIPWGIGLTIHAVVFFVSGGGFEERKYRQYLEEERRKEAGSH